jgi:hypothetical protein
MFLENICAQKQFIQYDAHEMTHLNELMDLKNQATAKQ